MVEIVMPAIDAKGGRYEWETFTHVPAGHEWASLQRRPGPLRWWIAKQFLKLGARIGRCTVSMAGTWHEQNSMDGKLAAVDSARRPYRGRVARAGSLPTGWRSRRRNDCL